MGLRRQAEIDLGLIMEDEITGFGWPITLTDPAGVVYDLVGLSNDVAQVIDPDTGQIVSGRLATVALRVTALTAKGAGRPVGVADASVKPWLVTFEDINGESYTFKVKSSFPDRTFGLIVCDLEVYG